MLPEKKDKIRELINKFRKDLIEINGEELPLITIIGENGNGGSFIDYFSNIEPHESSMVLSTLSEIVNKNKDGQQNPIH